MNIEFTEIPTPMHCKECHTGRMIGVFLTKKYSDDDVSIGKTPEYYYCENCGTMVKFIRGYQP